MKLAYVTCGLNFGGAEQLLCALVEDGLSHNDEVHVVATTRGGPLRNVLESLGAKVSVLHLASRADFRVPLKLARVLRTFRPDVIHSHLAVADIATMLARPWFWGVPMITTVHNPGIELGSFKKFLWHQSLPHFDAVFAVSKAVQSTIPTHTASRVVYPSLVTREPLQISSNTTTRQELRRALGIAQDEFVCLSIGRLHSIKGFDVLGEASTRIQAPKVRFVVIGEGPERERLSKYPKLELFGAKENAASLVPLADLLICPSRSEGFPQVPLHAMAARVPILASHVGGLTEVLEHGVHAYFVPPANPVSLAMAIEALRSTPEVRRSLANNAHAQLENKGLWKESMLVSTRNVYTQLVATAKTNRGQHGNTPT